MEQLIGKTISGFNLDPDKCWIEFNTSDGEKLHYEAHAECCSYSWIESIEDLDNLIGETIISVDEKDIDGRQEEEHEWLQVYNYDLNTCKGSCTIDFRNSSNGYYGGSLEFNECRSTNQR